MGLLLLVLLLSVEAVDRNAKVYFQKHQCYLKDVLIRIPSNPNQLAVHNKKNTLYFSTKMNGEYVPGMYDIDTKELRLINGVKDAYAIASNNFDDEIYFGGSDGIHRYRPFDRTLTSLAITRLDVWWLHFRKNLYFVQFPHLGAYAYADRTIKAVRQLKRTKVHQFVFDKHGYLYFLNISGLFGVKKHVYEHVLLRSSPPFLGMTTDNTGEVFVSTEMGIYVVSKHEQKLKRVARIPGVLAMTFDRHNNLIYSDGQEIVRLLPVTTETISKNTRKGNVYFCN